MTTKSIRRALRDERRLKKRDPAMQALGWWFGIAMLLLLVGGTLLPWVRR